MPGIMETMTQVHARLIAEGQLEPDAAQEALLPEFERIREGLTQPARGWFRRRPDPPKGLYIWGGVGRGKSMLMDMFVKTVPVAFRRVHFHAFMQEIHAGLHEARQRGEEDAIAPVAAGVATSARLLAFDEMQITDITDAMVVGRLFEALLDAGVVVVTTSNRVPDDLYKDGLNRQLFLPFIDLLKERMVVHELASPTDYRQGRIAGSPVYFSPLNSESRAAMDRIWADLSDGQEAPLTLTVNRREVTIPRFHNGVARAAFYDLCGKALGPADFLAIADAVRVLMLDNIPQMGRSNFNEAKRFVTLVDGLYEAGVQLVCSAAAEPEYLYLEGEGTFEFDRTASRLREMQSEAWARD